MLFKALLNRRICGRLSSPAGSKVPVPTRKLRLLSNSRRRRGFPSIARRKCQAGVQTSDRHDNQNALWMLKIRCDKASAHIFCTCRWSFALPAPIRRRSCLPLLCSRFDTGCRRIFRIENCHSADAAFVLRHKQRSVHSRKHRKPRSISDKPGWTAGSALSDRKRS